jgi:hypothetical protein
MGWILAADDERLASRLDDLEARVGAELRHVGV